MANPPGAAGPGAKYPQWTVILGGSQRVAEVTNPLEKALAESVAWPSKVYFFTSQAAAQAFANANGGSGSIPGVNQALNAGNQALNAGTQAVTDVASAGDWVARLTGWLGQGAIWLRIAEVAAGMLVLYIGLKATVTPPGQAPARTATKQTFKLAKKAIIK